MLSSLQKQPLVQALLWQLLRIAPGFWYCVQTSGIKDHLLVLACAAHEPFCQLQAGCCEWPVPTSSLMS